MQTLAEQIRSMSWGGEHYPAYALAAKSIAGAAETASRNRMGSMDKAADENAQAQNSTLSQYEGDLTKSPMFHKLSTMAIDDTHAAYNQARSKRAAMAHRAGFGYTSPQAGTDASTVDFMEAKDVGQTPTRVAEDLMPYQMQAAGMRGSNIGTYTGAGTSSMNTWATLEEQRKQRQMQMFSKIAGLGMQAATAFIPGANAGGG